MQAIFMARGPSFRGNVQIESLNNVDIYHIACRILELQPNPYATAGSLVNLTSLFRTIDGPITPPNHGISRDYTTPLALLLMMIFLSLFNFQMTF